MLYYDRIDFNEGIDFANGNNNRKSDIAIITIKGLDYHCIIHDISKCKAIHLLENYVLHDCGYLQNTYQKNQYKKSSPISLWKFSQSQKKTETRNILIDKKSYKDLVIYFIRYQPDKSIRMLNLYYDKLIGKIEGY